MNFYIDFDFFKNMKLLLTLIIEFLGAPFSFAPEVSAPTHFTCLNRVPILAAVGDWHSIPLGPYEGCRE